MSNEIIGIKQADGSFYPILQDGKPDNKTIELTTVRDGQTTARIHLYKKEPGSIDEPVYVDTLLIEHLVPHPKREPTMNLNINLDENNVLTAKVVDSETGNSSDIRVSLVNMPESQLQTQSDFTVTDAEPVFAEDVHTAMPDFDTDEFAVPTADEPKEKPVKDEPADLKDAPDTPVEKSTESKDDFADFGDFDLEDSDLNFDDSDGEKSAAAAMPEIPDFSEETESTEGSEALGDDAADSTMPGDTEMAAGKTDDFSFDMPDFDADEFDVSTDESKERQTEEKPTDIGSVPETSAEQTAESEDNFADFGDFNLEDSDLNFDSAEDKENDFVKSPSAAKENPPLYDLNLPDDIDENAGKKKCRIPMLICIICALLCILAVIGIFLRLPWKNRGGTQNADANIVTVEPPDQKEQPKDAVPPAPEENTIVIVEQEKVEKQEVIPEKTEPAPEVKPQTVRYLIKWGDTLWDLSDTYYRNPWLYPIIARENKIKNPDLIIAGTYINIPPR